MVGLMNLTSAQELVRRAGQGGFLVECGILHTLVITHTAVDNWELERAAWELNFQAIVEGVPSEHGQYCQAAVHLREIPGKQLFGAFPTTTDFLDALASVLRERKEDLEIYAELGIRFDEKVGEEIQNDPEVVRIEGEIQKTRMRWREQVRALALRKLSLRAEVEERREDYVIVADGRV
jgi:hypothetical protein